MTAFRTSLPQLGGGLFITDGGLETSLIFHEGWDLPYFAAFDLLRSAKGRDALKRYFDPYLDIASTLGAGFILESPTWRASIDWGRLMGLSAADMSAVNRDAVALMHQIRDERLATMGPIVVSGCVGPRGDGYSAEGQMTAAEAADYHLAQVAAFAGAGADMATGITMTSSAEATGIAIAAQRAGLPVALSFTVETDGRLPSGEALKAAIEGVDRATGNYPAYYMVNCAHPSHFDHLFGEAEGWMGRLRGLRANASRCSHAELDEATELDDGNPLELGADYARLMASLPSVCILGGCCGTDHRHVSEMGARCAPLLAAAE